MLKKVVLILFIIFAFNTGPANATHNRAGEITYKQISDLTFEITIWTYTYTLSAADRDQLPVDWGDGTTSIAPRIEKISLPYFYRRNRYIIRHTYPGPGVYRITVQDPNRNYGILNIPNSVNVYFSIQTTLMVNTGLGGNNTPELLNPPYDKAGRGKLFIHNPAAYDQDGDSLAYSLTVCTREDGIPIENYTLPPATDTLYVDPISGDLVWDTPVDTGKYNVAMNIEEFRYGVKIGNVVRDLQIDVHETDNNPPITEPLRDFCVVAGDSVVYAISSIDNENDSMRHLMTGGGFKVTISPSVFKTIFSEPGEITSVFKWKTVCTHVRQQPYTVFVKAEDNNSDLPLVDISNFNIRVLGPPIQNLRASPSSNLIRLDWSRDTCSIIQNYRIYRKIGYTGFVPDSCETGVPSATGYVKVGETTGSNDTVFIDDNNGAGLMQGMDYCYLVFAVYPDGSESIASEEVCSILIHGTPILTNVSILNTDTENGSVYVAWAKPRQLDTIPANGPYEYLIYRSSDLYGTDFSFIRSIETSDLNDTSFVDMLINTLDFAYTYKVELYNNESGNRFMIGSPAEASTIFLKIIPGDEQIEIRCRKNVPWINTAYVVYRQNKSTLVYDSIGITNDTVYIDSGLQNSENYCYKIKSIGSYNRPNLPSPLLNYSHEVCGTPLDNEPPCAPSLIVTSMCDSLYNYVVWTNPNNSCADDVVSYKLYFKAELESELSLLEDEFSSAMDTTYKHYISSSLAGCYAVKAVDLLGNESDLSSPTMCVDSCVYFELPNVFTPNGDNINDVLLAHTSPFIERVDMKIFSRSGVLVFETDDPYINWNGKQKGKNNFVAPGIYYYICDIYEKRLSGLEVRNVTGFVHVITEKGARISNE
ncbi:MAG: gliding motility-associated C-terminal domain-containing protein [Bacteroidales bacterium]|nr:gliding motility-associated C-terminal domain-containing protein [Bacteroidales bacterium]